MNPDLDYSHFCLCLCEHQVLPKVPSQQQLADFRKNSSEQVRPSTDFVKKRSYD